MRLFGWDKVSNLYGQDNILNQLTVWDKINQNGLVKTSEAPVLWCPKRQIHIPDEFVEFKMFSGVEAWLKFELGTVTETVT